jgi:hypothetical protein
VKEVAEVSVNGTPIGVMWKPPFLADVTPAVRPGSNAVEIKVTSLWVNRLIGDQQLPQDRRYLPSNWSLYKADSPLVPSGLLGPVVLRPVTRVRLT